MKYTKPFNQFITEARADMTPAELEMLDKIEARAREAYPETSPEANKIDARLRDLGLAPKEEFDDRWNNMIDEWGSDPEINQALDTLKERTKSIINKHIDFSDPEDETEFEQRVEWIYEQGADDIGHLELMMINGDY
jgi:hypothetical protein